MNVKTSLNEVEAETVMLLAVYELINSIANHDLLLIEEGEVTEVRFKDSVRARFFNLCLVDFLSKTDKDAPIPQSTYLEALTKIGDSPRFNGSNTIDSLKNVVADFRMWLSEKITVPKVWLPTIELELDLKIRRIDIHKIAGNVCKHNLLRGVQTMHAFRKVLQENGHEVDLNTALLLVDEVYEWLHEHKFMAQSNAIVEFLNNIRWGIYDYLRPEYLRSMVVDTNGVRYSYTYPAEVCDDFARANYWELMNMVRSPPYLPRFTVPEFWKNDVDKY